MPDDWGVTHLAELAARASEHGTPGAVWSLAMSDLNLNLVRFGGRDGVEAHVNAEVDVAGVVIAGEGTLEVDGRVEALRVGDVFHVPKGARRAIHADGGDLVYLTCHRRRAGLMPTRARH
jgi:quercetin dioxygenase-like cupin family protein